MKWWRSIIALAAAGVCAFAALRLGETPQSTGPARAPLVASDSIDTDKVVEILLDRDGVRHRFVRTGNSWQQTEPVVHAIDGWSMRQIMGKLLKTESVRTVVLSAADAESASELAAAGLSPASSRIELREAAGPDKPGRVVAVELGRRSLAGRAFARVVGPTTRAEYQVVDAELHEYALGRDPKEFRRRDLFIDLGEVDRVSYRTAGGELVLERKGRDYAIRSPVQTRADRVQVEEFLDAVRRSKSAGFVADRPIDLSVYGLAPAIATLSVDAGGVRRALLVGDAVSIGAQDRFGLIDGTTTVVRIPAPVLAPMLPRVERLIDAVATGVRARDIGGIEIASGATRISLRRETDGWSGGVGAQGDAAVEQGRFERPAVEGLLKALTETRAGSVELAAFPEADAVATVTLVGFAGEPLDTVRIARRASDGKSLLENGDGVLRVHGAIELPLSAQELGFLRSAAAPAQPGDEPNR